MGSIQKLHTRNTNLLTLCEDKIVKILADKDALFNADGNTNVTATNKVLGAADAYKGNFGISTNPESFIASPFQVYFADPIRGQICALSGEGVRSISDLGMKDYFADLLKDNVHRVIGSYDAKKKEYNVTVEKKYRTRQLTPTTTTISYSETKKGWVSFKSFAQEMGISLNNNYYTFNSGELWKHHDNETRNNFYGAQYTSTIELLFNDNSTAVKSFGSINYEGTQAKVPQFAFVSHVNTWNGDQSDSDGTTTTSFGDGEYYNLTASTGWHVTSINTDLQISDALYFKDKEGKWFGQIRGSDEGIDNLDSTWKLKEFSSQGLGNATITHSDPTFGEKGAYTIKNNTSTTYEGDDGSGGAWDSTADSLVDIAYSVDTATINTQVGVATGAVTGNLTITNIVNGVYSGYPLSASDFSCPNKDSEVNSVTFTDNGTAGDPANTVNVAVLLNDTTPAGGTLNQDIFIDIDSAVKHESDREDRLVCFKTIITEQSNSTVTIVDVSNITESTVTASSTKTTTHSGSISETPTTIAQITIAASGGYFIQGNNVSTTFANLGSYFNNYSVSGVTTASTNGLATSQTYTVTYNPPTFGSLAVDPSDLCELAHQLRFSYKIGQIQAAVTNTITDVIVNKTNIDSSAGSSLIIVKGVPGTQYNISATKMASVGSGSAHGTNPNYNFTTNAFQSGSSETAGTIGSNGQNVHQLGLDYHAADAQYDIKITAGGSPSSTLASSVPTAFGDLSIVKRANKTITITPATSSSPSNFGTLPSAVVITRKSNSDVKAQPTGYYCYAQGSTELRGSSKGSASTRFALSEPGKSRKIKQGMRVFGTGVASGCTVVEVRNQYVTLSATSTIDDAKLLFVDLGSRFTALSFTILPNSNTLNVNSSNSVEDQFANTVGFGETTKTVNGAASSGRDIVLDDVENLPVGATVSGTNIGVGRTIASINEGSKTITLSADVTGTVADEATLTFGGGLGEQTSIFHESVTKVGNNIIIEALLSVEDLDSTVSTTLNIDNLITVS